LAASAGRPSGQSRGRRTSAERGLKFKFGGKLRKKKCNII
jgi:hypothetical protein